MRRRLVASYLALTAFVVVILGVPMARTTLDSERRQLRAGIEHDAFVLASTLEDALSTDPSTASGPAADVVERYHARTGARVVVTDAAGTAIADNDPPAPGERSFRTRPEMVAALSGRVGIEERWSRTLGHRALFVAVPVASGGEVHGVVRVSVTTASVERAVRSRLAGLLLAVAVTFAGAAVVAVLLARSLTTPLRSLGGVARAFGHGELGRRADEASGPPEVRDLAAELNAMAARLAELIASQERFVADASHQLRSPLTALRLRLEAMEFAAPERREAHRAAAVTEIARFSRTIDGLLELSRPAGPHPGAVADLAAVARDRLEHWSALAAERGVILRAEASLASTAPLPVHAAPDRVAQVLDNLIANAIDATSGATTSSESASGEAGRAGPAGPAAVAVGVRSSATGVSITVVDNGPGMSDDEIARAFERFWRARSTASDLSGSGLGLAIARRLVVADGGTIALTGAEGGGLTATVRYRPAPVPKT